MRGFLGTAIVISIFALAAAIGVYLYTKPKTPTSVTPPVVTPSVQTQEAMVTIMSKGFEPATIAIKKGEQVTWVNTDSKPHQVASDPHPIHTGLPGFDSKVALTTNDAYTYTFEKSGTFTYHDHLNPLKYHGTVIVE